MSFKPHDYIILGFKSGNDGGDGGGGVVGEEGLLLFFYWAGER